MKIKKLALPNGAVFTKTCCKYTLVEIAGIRMHFKTLDIRLEEGLVVRENYRAAYRLIVHYNANEYICFMDDVPPNIVKKFYYFGVQVMHANVGGWAQDSWEQLMR